MLLQTGCGRVSGVPVKLWKKKLEAEETHENEFVGQSTVLHTGLATSILRLHCLDHFRHALNIATAGQINWLRSVVSQLVCRLMSFVLCSL